MRMWLAMLAVAVVLAGCGVLFALQLSRLFWLHLPPYSRQQHGLRPS